MVKKKRLTEFDLWLKSALKEDSALLKALSNCSSKNISLNINNKSPRKFESWWRMFEKENGGILDDLA